MKKVLIINATQMVSPKGNKALHGKDMNKVDVINHGAIYIEDGIIVDVGSTEDLLSKFKNDLNYIDKIIDANGKAIIPGMIDSHTHFVFGGYRPSEFMSRLKGATYMDIMKNGGGIANTVKATRLMRKEDLIISGRKRLQDYLEQGITTIEGKSGYGLDFDCEIKQLEVMKELNEEQPIDIITTYLGAHDVAPEYKDDPEAYITYMAEKVLPYVKEHKLAKYVDVFCEDSVFDIEQSKKILMDAKAQGFDVKMHADEIVSLGGAELAAQIHATSADHLLAASEKGIEALAESDTVATLLPCTAFCLNKPYADARKMIDRGCAVALASDYNPGSCFTNSIPLLIALGAIQMKMCLEEVLTALTINSAAALGIADKIGSIEVGKQADILILDEADYQFLVYHTGKNIVNTVIKGGEIVYKKNK